MSASSTHCALVFLARAMKHCSPASAVERSGLNPYEFGSAVGSATGSRASRCNACIALQRITGMPSGLLLPFFFGIITLRSGRAEYPRLFNDAIALVFAPGVFQMTLSTPGVFLPLFSVTRLTANALPLNELVRSHCKACTLVFLPACVHFTIRACSRLT